MTGRSSRVGADALRHSQGELAGVVAEVDAREVAARVEHVVDEGHGPDLALEVQQEFLGRVVGAPSRLEGEKPGDRRKVVLDPMMDLAQELVLLRHAARQGRVRPRSVRGNRGRPRTLDRGEPRFRDSAAPPATGRRRGCPGRRRGSRAPVGARRPFPFFPASPALEDRSSPDLSYRRPNRRGTAFGSSKGESTSPGPTGAPPGSARETDAESMEERTTRASRLGEESLVGLPLLAPGAVPRDGGLQRVAQPGEAILEQIVRGAALDAIGGELVVERAGDDEGGKIGPPPLEYLEHAERAEGRHLEVRDDCVIGLGEGRDKIRLVVDPRPPRIHARTAHDRLDELGVVGIVFHEEDL